MFNKQSMTNQSLFPEGQGSHFHQFAEVEIRTTERPIDAFIKRFMEAVPRWNAAAARSARRPKATSPPSGEIYPL
jgi:hypothetical protein